MAELGKKLGKLSLAILENFVERVLGEKFVAELYEPTGRVLAIIGALEESEKLFVAKYDDKDLSKALFVDMKQSDRPTLGEAVGKYFDHPTDPSLRQSLQEILFDEFRNFLSKERIDKAVDFYIKLLTKELMLKDDVFRDNIAALAIVDTNLLEQRQVELLEQIAEKIVNQQVASQQVFRSLHQLPPPPADFTGREQLITDLLKDFESHKGATISGLTGMGGIGKTALGLAVAHQIAKNYPDAQIFLDLKGTTAPLSAVDIARHVILSFEPSADLRALDENNMQAVYQSVLHGKKVLLFFDNARSADQIAKLIPPETCAMLVTSRWNFTVAGLRTHKVGVMEEREAIDFLLELCPRIAGKASDLANACGKLPLALRVAGSFLEVNRQKNVDEYLEELKSAKGRLATLTTSRLSAELTAEPDVLATFELSYNQLQNDQKERWRALGVFPASFDATAVAAIWEMGRGDTENFLGLLLRYSLVDFNITSSRYELHDLLIEYACSQMKVDEEPRFRLRHASYYCNDMLGLSYELYLAGDENVVLGLRLLDLEWTHICSGQSWATEQGVFSAELCMQYPRAYELLALRLPPRMNISWLESAIKGAALLKDDTVTAELNGVIGINYGLLGENSKAIEFYEQALNYYASIKDQTNQCVWLGNLGNAYFELNETQTAIKYYEQALEIAREIRNRKFEASWLGSLGIIYRNLGENSKAVETYEQVLEIQRTIGDRRSEGITIGNLGVAFKMLGHIHKAIEFYEQALEIAHQIGDQQREGLWLYNLGNTYCEAGQKEKGIKLLG